MRHAIDWWMFVAVREDPWSAEIYQHARAAGPSVARSRCPLGADSVRCWHDHTVYDPAVHHRMTRPNPASKEIRCWQQTLPAAANDRVRNQGLTAGVCVVHLIRSSMRFVSYGQRKAIAAALKSVCTAPTADAAAEAFEEFAN